ncbi:MAG: mercuric reductase [Elusimicrobia bacterium]|nr:MAG: mercuric reductase [Elusimicrobiota bacterium]KAF0154013.1 MAG: mercuric reductase [Elusimicrobiota bacterium]
MKYDYHAVVIGAGSGGLVVAAGCANFGARVALVEGAQMGGDCLNAGCVPSKAFLRGAHAAAAARELARFGVTARVEGVDLAKAMDRVAAIIKEVSPRDSEERFRGLGVEVIRALGTLVDAHTVKAGDRLLTAKHIVLATGSEPLVPAIPGLDGVKHYTNRDIFTLRELPRKLLVLGAGPIGLELGQAFRHLGSEVEVIDQAPSLFGKDDPEVGPLMLETLTAEGIVFSLGAKILGVSKSGDRVSIKFERGGKPQEAAGDALLVALGRKPVTAGLGLEAAGVLTDARGYIKTDARLRTSVPSIYACGDCTGPYLFTHTAGYQAGIIIRNIILSLPAKTNYHNLAWTTYTRPEVAHVGLTEQEAAKAGLLRDKVLVPIAENDRAMAEEDREGFLKFVIGPKGRLLGATLVGEKAGEMIGAASLAVTNKLKATAFASVMFSYPTEAEIFKTASYDYMKRGFKPWMKKLVKSVLLRGTAAAGPETKND